VVEPTMTYAQVTAKPLAALDRSRHVLLVYDAKTEQPKDADPAAADPAPEEPK
jgi:hypothetical protein